MQQQAADLQSKLNTSFSSIHSTDSKKSGAAASVTTNQQPQAS
jgi:hypothetical protein